MSLAVYGIQAVNFNATQYAGTQGVAADYRRIIRTRNSDGVVQPTFRHISQLAPSAKLSSLALKSWVSALNDSSDFLVKALDGANGMKLYGAKAASSLAGYASGTVHEQLAALLGAVWAEGISWDGQNGEASIDLAAAFLSSDGSTAALIPTAVALPTQPIPTERFDLTSLTVGGTEVDGVASVSLSIDPKPLLRHNNGKVYPTALTFAGASDAMEVALRFTVLDLALARSIGALGTTGQVVVTFSKFNANSATRGSDTVTFTLNNCLVHHPTPHSARQGAPIDCQIEVLPSRDGSNRMLSWGTT